MLGVYFNTVGSNIHMCNVKMFLHVVVHVQTSFFVVHNEVTDIYRMTHHDFLIIGFQQLLLFVMFVLALCHNCSCIKEQVELDMFTIKQNN